MNITHYYLEMEFCTSQKNNLQKEAKQYLDSISRTLISASDLEDVKKIIFDKIAILNAANPRCSSLKIEFYTNYRKTIMINGIAGVNFQIKPAELSHLTHFIK